MGQPLSGEPDSPHFPGPSEGKLVKVHKCSWNFNIKSKLFHILCRNMV
ncbi:hypothetical protein CLOSTASPAR_03974 [[Clostridium] asparagiforme DSM 15981]|uniref:Uncharacterized protein n=1 Tax=[Clostridium] asparagiforme DSM 15981 TaxID=518636 RepID=C0D3Y3_9FIRM|nr:hypothetical protein CLOSTASPAR_03974 [[Clostridium] asparagiforme DSM 15981]